MNPKTPNHSTCIAFCGGIATGKSTLINQVAEMLARSGLSPVILDFDQQRRICVQNSRNNQRLRLFLGATGEFVPTDTAMISRFILSDPHRMIEFNEILGAEIIKRIRTISNTQSPPIILLEWPGPLPNVLLEFGISRIVNLICPVRVQLQRLAKGDLSLGEVRRRIRMQQRVTKILRRHSHRPELIVDTSESSTEKIATEVVPWILEDHSLCSSDERAA